MRRGGANSPDGKRIVSVSGFDGTPKVWDATSGQETLTLQGHGSIDFRVNAVRSVALLTVLKEVPHFDGLVPTSAHKARAIRTERHALNVGAVPLKP